MTIEELAEKLGITLTGDMQTAVGAYVAAQTAGLKANRDQVQADNRKLKDKLKAFDGLDPEALAAALEELDLTPGDIVDKLKAQPGSSADAVRAAEAAAEAKYQRQLAKAAKDKADAEARAAASDKARCDAEVERALHDEIAKKKGTAALLLPAMRGRVKSEIGEDGKVRITVLAPNGEEMQTDAGAPGTVADLVEAFRRDQTFGVAFEAQPGGSGAGAGGKRTPGGVNGNPFKRGTPAFSLTEQAKLRAENPSLADQLKREAAA